MYYLNKISSYLGLLLTCFIYDIVVSCARPSAPSMAFGFCLGELKRWPASSQPWIYHTACTAVTFGLLAYYYDHRHWPKVLEGP